jgi:hypothetical protein
LNENIITAIEETREKMIETIQKYGIGNQQSVSISQDLDKLIIKYQRSANNTEPK